MNTENLVELAEAAISYKMGQSLSSIQILILQACCQDAKKTYKQIAQQNRYSENYLTKKVVPGLWQILSEAFGEKVTKANCRLILEKHRESFPRTLRGVKLESPEGQVPLASPFYISRPLLEQRCYQEIMQPGSLLQIAGPGKMGKTSLLARMLAYAEGQDYYTVRLNLERAGSNVLASESNFWRWICANATRQLGLSGTLEDYWDEDMGVLMNCTIYFRQYLLGRCDRPIVLAFDEVNRLFEYPAITRDFFGMVRSWSEEAKDCSVWQKLRTVLVYSTNGYIPTVRDKSDILKLLHLRLALELPHFTPFEVQDLARRHKLELSSLELTQLQSLLGGFPYLVRSIFYQAVRYQLNLKQLMANAATDGGIFSHHLHEQLWYLQENPSLLEAYQQVVRADTPITLEQKLAFGLKNLGLVRLQKNQVTVSCQLYLQYFQDRLA